MNENFQNQEASFYQTGRTQPPKKRGGLFALVLVAFIFLSGIVSVLGLLNIRLFRKAEKDAQESSVAFFRLAESSVQSAAYTGSFYLPSLGVSGAFTDPLDQLLYSLPQGFYISSVEDGSNAAAKGLLPGDIIQSLDGVTITETDSLQSFLNSLSENQSVRLVIFRGGYQFFLDIAANETQ